MHGLTGYRDYRHLDRDRSPLIVCVSRRTQLTSLSHCMWIYLVTNSRDLDFSPFFSDAFDPLPLSLVLGRLDQWQGCRAGILRWT